MNQTLDDRYTNTELRKLQKVELILLREVKRICEKHNIQYFIAYGTLLGAARHQGFIPWDDDIDVGMLRCEYNKFLEACKTELDSRFFLQTMETDDNFAIPWAKLQLNGTIRLDESATEADTHAGIDLDIFPFDNTSSISLLSWLQKNIAFMMRGVYIYKCNYTPLNREHSLKKKLGLYLCKVISWCLDKNTVAGFINKSLQWYSTRDTKYVNDLTAPYNNGIFTRELVSTLVELPFEGEMYPVFADYKKYLARTYGEDWMEMPPMEKRIQHPIVKLDLGVYDSDKYLK